MRTPSSVQVAPASFCHFLGAAARWAIWCIFLLLRCCTCISCRRILLSCSRNSSPPMRGACRLSLAGCFSCVLGSLHRPHRRAWHKLDTICLSVRSNHGKFPVCTNNKEANSETILFLGGHISYDDGFCLDAKKALLSRSDNVFVIQLGHNIFILPIEAWRKSRALRRPKAYGPVRPKRLLRR